MIMYMLAFVASEIYRYKNMASWLTAAQINELNDIMTYFHEDPNYEDFLKVYNNKSGLSSSNASKTHKFWLYGVYLTHPEMFSESQKQYVSSNIREIERGLKRIERHPTAELINCVWALYFSTGNKQYSDLIKSIAENSNIISVADHAANSYHRVIGERLTIRDDLEEADDEVGMVEMVTNPQELVPMGGQIIVPN